MKSINMLDTRTNLKANISYGINDIQSIGLSLQIYSAMKETESFFLITNFLVIYMCFLVQVTRIKES